MNFEKKRENSMKRDGQLNPDHAHQTSCDTKLYSYEYVSGGTFKRSVPLLHPPHEHSLFYSACQYSHTPPGVPLCRILSALSLISHRRVIQWEPFLHDSTSVPCRTRRAPLPPPPPPPPDVPLAYRQRPRSLGAGSLHTPSPCRISRSSKLPQPSLPC